jgi:hypothetical protein
MAVLRFALALSGCVALSLVSATVAADKPVSSDLETALDTAQTSGKLVFVYAFDSV